MKYIKSQQWLYAHLGDPNVRIVDCRFTLANPVAGTNAYVQAHIPGSVYFDLEKDLSGIVTKHGGRHPLPEIDRLKVKLEEAGIDQDTTLVAYDFGDGAFAGRFWWILTYLGHEKVYILDGGYKGWNEAQLPTDKEFPVYSRKELMINLQPSMLATYDDIRDSITNGAATLIDSRARTRYLGLEEPIDKKPGHIPTAINKEWEEGLKDGKWRSVEEQKERFKDINPLKPVVVYCGSGVTATPNVLALMEAGYQQVKLYAGSYSDWVSYDENKVITEK